MNNENENNEIKKSAVHSGLEENIKEINSVNIAENDENCFDSDFLRNAGKNKKRKNALLVTNIICIAVVALIYGALVCLNAFQRNRATVSESEKRLLTEMPSVSFDGLANGEYTEQLEHYVSDTFWQREKFITAAKKIQTLYGFSLKVGVGDFSIIKNNTENKTEDEIDDDELRKLIEEQRRKQTSDTAPAETTPAETTPAETTRQETTPVEATPQNETPEEEKKPNTEVTMIALSTDSISIAVGSGTVLSYTLYPVDVMPDKLEWTVADEGIIEYTESSEGLKIVGKAAGKTIVTCSSGKASSSATVTVKELKVNNENQMDDAEFFGGGIVLFNGATYIQGWFAPQATGYMSQCMDYYAEIFPDTRISFLPAPVSAVVIDDPTLVGQLSDQGQVLSQMQEKYSEKINFVNIYDAIWSHRKEYLYFKSDHHWTQRGAYYAYAEFAKSVGFTPTPLEDFEYEIINEEWRGSMYSFTQDERVLDITDFVECFTPRKQCTMTITDANGATRSYDTCILKSTHNYSSFIAGDNAYTVINVPDNPQDLSILVFKDSYGNALVPFLTEHYGNIIVIDPRHLGENVYEQFKNYGLDDILFMNNIQMANTTAFVRMYFAAVGIDWSTES